MTKSSEYRRCFSHSPLSLLLLCLIHWITELNVEKSRDKNEWNKKKRVSSGSNNNNNTYSDGNIWCVLYVCIKRHRHSAYFSHDRSCMTKNTHCPLYTRSRVQKKRKKTYNHRTETLCSNLLALNIVVALSPSIFVCVCVFWILCLKIFNSSVHNPTTKRISNVNITLSWVWEKCRSQLKQLKRKCCSICWISAEWIVECISQMKKTTQIDDPVQKCIYKI